MSVLSFLMKFLNKLSHLEKPITLLLPLFLQHLKKDDVNQGATCQSIKYGNWRIFNPFIVGSFQADANGYSKGCHRSECADVNQNK